MADGENLIFDWELLDDARSVLEGRPEQTPLDSAQGMSAAPAAFGTADGGAAAAARLNDWIAQAKNDLTTVSTEVASLATAAGLAAQAARDLDISTQGIAKGNETIAEPLQGPAPRLGGG